MGGGGGNTGHGTIYIYIYFFFKKKIPGATPCCSIWAGSSRIQNMVVVMQ